VGTGVKDEGSRGLGGWVGGAPPLSEVMAEVGWGCSFSLIAEMTIVLPPTKKNNSCWYVPGSSPTKYNS
jgi:hypothetical protein